MNDVQPVAPLNTRGRPNRRYFLIGCVAIAIIASLIFGRSWLGWAGRAMATRQFNCGAISASRWWLDRVDRYATADWHTTMLRAKCHRYLGQVRSHARALKEAAQRGAPEAEVQTEQTLMNTQAAELYRGAEQLFTQLLDAGVPSDELGWAFVHGYLLRQRQDRAQALLTAWQADLPNNPHVKYMWGQFYWQTGDAERAHKAFQECVELQPRYELASLELARLDNEAGHRQRSLQALATLASNCPQNETIVSELARMLRESGRARAALEVLARLRDTNDVPSRVAVELAQVTLELGKPETAVRWFEEVDDRDLIDQQVLSSFGTALVLMGDTVRGERAFQWILDETDTVGQLHDLQGRLSTDPNDKVAGPAMQQLMRRLSQRSPDTRPMQLATPEERIVAQDSTPGVELYLQHCSACHGMTGAGDGRAARYVWPRPRNLRDGKTRLISTRNGTPTQADIVRSIRDGIPGTAMAANGTLSPNELRQLADIVLRMRRDGLRDQAIARFVAADEEVDADEVNETVQLRSTPGAVVETPEWPAANDAARRRGKAIYQQQGCAQCHGETGTGDPTNPLLDDSGRPTFPRDLVSDVFKGGHSDDSLFLRILLGMPGTPHPSSLVLEPTQVIDLVSYCQTLGKTPKKLLTNRERFLRATTRPLLESTLTDDLPGR